MKGWLRFLVAASLLWSCNKPDAPDCFQKAGDPAVESRTLSAAVSRIELTEYIHLQLSNPDGQAPYVIVEAPENLLPEIITELDGDGVLTIRNDNTCNFMRRYDHLIRVTYVGPLEHVVNRGTGDLTSTEALTTALFELENRDASGVIQLDFAGAESVIVKDHTGVGDVTLTGTTEVLELFNQGWGPLDASGLQATTALTNNTSINVLRVRATDYVYTEINGPGNTEVFGNPGFIDILDQGDGEMIEMN